MWIPGPCTGGSGAWDVCVSLQPCADAGVSPVTCSEEECRSSQATTVGRGAGELPFRF
jgi:hypothetical protein